MIEARPLPCDQKLCFNAQQKVESNRRQLHGRRIQDCFHGWMILSDHPDSVLWSLWNPLTSELIRLPPLITEEKDYHACCLSSPPVVEGSVFMLLSFENPTIFFCRLGRERKRLQWTQGSYAKPLQTICGRDDCLLRRPTCCNGNVYALASMFALVIQVDIVVNCKQVDQISLTPFVKTHSTHRCRPWSRCPQNNSIHICLPFLKGSGVDLFYIEVGFKDELVAEAYLFKLDMTSKMWTEMVDLKGAAFFLELANGYLACYNNCAVDSKLGGYMHILGECGKVIYSFHVKDRTLSLFSLPCQSQPFSWAMLQWRLEVAQVEEEEEEEEEDKDTEIVGRPSKDEIDSATNESRLLSMPLHILELIMELCIGVEYMKFRATCKHCCLAAPSIQWSSNTRLRSYSLFSPWLMVLDNYRDTITFIDPMFGDRYFIKIPQELKEGYEIYYSRYGWLLMYNPRKFRMVFFNPLTSNIRELPIVRYMESFCFSAPPTSPDCMVVGFSRHGSLHLVIHFVSGESTWDAYDLNDDPDSLINFKHDPYSFQFPTFSGRCIYGLCNNERIEAFRDIADDGYDWELVADKAPSRSAAQYFLSVCDQHLLLVILGEFGGSVEVFKLDESTQEWEKTNDLGNHMIYISNTSCFCLEAKSPEMGNKIYFPRLLHDDNTKIVFYSFETCRYHTFKDKNIQESFGDDIFRAKHLCFPHAWIEPSWS